jgi:hypothetical protein
MSVVQTKITRCPGARTLVRRKRGIALQSQHAIRSGDTYSSGLGQGLASCGIPGDPTGQPLGARRKGAA